MQLFALDSEGQPISAQLADKGSDYRCLECSAIVRKRSGPHRQPHFFHLRDSPSCFLSGKGMAHLQIQCYLWQLLPKGECQLEYRFPSIGRIADVAWLSEKLIFEVQCSPISGEEIAARNRDYQSLGFQVVWILHDSRYNQRLVSDAEQELKEAIHYFSNIDEEGSGGIYDQFDQKKGGVRVVKFPKLPVDLSQPRRGNFKSLRPKWPLYFAGDLLDLQSKGSSDYIQRVFALKKEKGYFSYILKAYQLLIQMLLERSCR